jgi:hypothetical protein
MSTGMRTDLVARTLREYLSNAGYKHKGNTWYCETDETILVINLQKSQYGKQYYLNLGVWVKAFEPAAFPKEHKCHIRARLGDIISAKEERNLDSAFDLASRIDARKREAVVLALMQRGVAWLGRLGSIAGIRDALSKGELDSVLVQIRARAFVEDGEASR